MTESYEKGKVVCFTGHRHLSLPEKLRLKGLLRHEIEHQIQAGATVFRAGGALGFDTLAAQTVLQLRRRHPHIQLELVLPCPSQADHWDPSDRAVYEQILASADRSRYVGDAYFNGILQMRNRALVLGSDVCIAFLKCSGGGGTAYTSALALREGLEFVNLLDEM